MVLFAAGLAGADPGTGVDPAPPDAIPVDGLGLPLWQKAAWEDFPVRIELPDRPALDRLLARIPLASFAREQIRPVPGGGGRLVLEIRITSAEAAALEKAGVAFFRVEDRALAGRREVEAAWARSGLKSGAELLAATTGYYPTHAQVGAILAQLAADHPDICRTFSWGQSVQGRQLWGLVISADVMNSTAEPEVRLSSTMHGDEPPGMVMLLDLAEHLVTNYGAAGYEDVTGLVDGYEIHLMPLHNPDGYVGGFRTNVNGRDLNRNFPAPAPVHPVQEIENVHFMNYALSRHFVIGENGHAGALVVNYPWDYQFALAPDDAAFIRLSLEYSTTNTPMYNGFFSQGITNGAAWYIANGTLQDWAYVVTGSLDVTIEYSNIKWPAAAGLDQLWDDNRDSFMHFIKSARYGVNGVVTAADTGQPLSATVTVAGNARSVQTDPAHGDYYKLLDTGTYDLTFAADGYETELVTGVSTVWGTPTVLDVALTPDASAAPRPPAVLLRITATPNPFNPRTTLHLTLPEGGAAAVTIHDMQGGVVRRLYDGTPTAGTIAVDWDGRADDGAAAPSGIYFARLVRNGQAAATKLTLLR